MIASPLPIPKHGRLPGGFEFPPHWLLGSGSAAPSSSARDAREDAILLCPAYTNDRPPSTTITCPVTKSAVASYATIPADSPTRLLRPEIQMPTNTRAIIASSTHGNRRDSRDPPRSSCSRPPRFGLQCMENH